LKKTIIGIVSLLFILLLANNAISMISMEYSVSNSGTEYTLEFEIFNDVGSLENLDWFEIYFGETTDGLNFTETSDYTNLDPDLWGTENPAGWFSYSYEASPAFNAPAQFNADIDTSGNFALDLGETGLAPGSSLGGFTVSFDWMGSGAFDQSLYFRTGKLDDNDPDFYSFVEDGYATRPISSGQVPEPGTMFLLGTGLMIFAFARRRT